MGDEAKAKGKTVGQRGAREKGAVGRGASLQGSQLLSVSWLRRSGRRVTSDVTYTWGLLQDLGMCPESSLCRADQGGSSLPLEQGGGWSYFLSLPAGCDHRTWSQPSPEPAEGCILGHLGFLRKAQLTMTCQTCQTLSPALLGTFQLESVCTAGMGLNGCPLCPEALAKYP